MKTKDYFKEIFAENPNQDSVIDAVRALSVLSIIAFHVVVGIIQIYDHEKAKQYILNMPDILQPLWHGEKGVDAFFLISATVLGIPLFKKLESFDWLAAKAFYKKRFYRIYPLFFVALVLYTIAQWSYFGQYFFTNALLINNLIEGQRTIIPVGWSLLVEVQYYAVLPLLFLYLQRIKFRFSALLVLLLASFAACALRLWQYPDLYLRPITDIFLSEDRSAFTTRLGNFFYEANMTRFGPFVVGLMLAYLKVNYAEKLQKLLKNNSAVFLSLFMGFALIGFSVLMPMYDPSSFYYNNFSTELNFLVLSCIRQFFAIGLALLILGCWFSEKAPFQILNRLSRSRFWAPFSRLSFPIYLFHFPFIALAAVVVFGTTNVKEIAEVSFFQGLGVFTLATLLTVLFSIPLYIYVERPFIARGKK